MNQYIQQGFGYGIGIGLATVFFWLVVTFLYVLAVSGAFGIVWRWIRAFFGFWWSVLKWLVS